MGKTVFEVVNSEVLKRASDIRMGCRVGKVYPKCENKLCDPVPGSFSDECGVVGCKRFG